MPTITATFAGRLRALREAAGWSQRELADASGLHVNAIARLERGERLPTWLTVQKLAGALRVSTEALRDG